MKISRAWKVRNKTKGALLHRIAPVLFFYGKTMRDKTRLEDQNLFIPYECISLTYSKRRAFFARQLAIHGSQNQSCSTIGGKETSVEVIWRVFFDFSEA